MVDKNKLSYLNDEAFSIINEFVDTKALASKESKTKVNILSSPRPLDAILDVLDSKVKDSSINIIARPLKTMYINVLDSVANDPNEGSAAGYCMKFKNSEAAVFNMWEAWDICEINQLVKAFYVQCEIEKVNAMYSDPYYLILLVVITYGIRHNDNLESTTSYTRIALSILLFRLWNGRIRIYIKICNKDVMNSVIANCNNRFLAKKYNTPLEMLSEYFGSTLLKKYGQSIKLDSSKSKTIIDQGWNRLRQLFYSQKILDLMTDKVSFASGIAPLYYKAAANNDKISTKKIVDDSEENKSVDDNFTSNIFDRNIDDITNFIVTNMKPSYNRNFINFIKSDVKLIKENYLIAVINGIHNNKYSSKIQSILELLFKKIFDIDERDICPASFLTTIIKKRINSSKHNVDITNINNIIFEILEDIFKTKIDNKIDFNSWSNTQRVSFKNIIVYAIAYNIQLRLCFNKL